jgi:RNAse (barnase) inhibitor barstar
VTVPEDDVGAHRALTDLIEGRLKPGVYQWRAPAAPGAGVAGADWPARAEEQGWRAFYLNGRRARDKESFLRVSAEAFAFPEWFGGNWDAFEDCLKDLSWAPARRGYLVLYEAWAELAEADQRAFRTALDIFSGAVTAWQDTATPMSVLLSSIGVEVAGVPKLG